MDAGRQAGKHETLAGINIMIMQLSKHCSKLCLLGRKEQQPPPQKKEHSAIGYEFLST